MYDSVGVVNVLFVVLFEKRRRDLRWWAGRCQGRRSLAFISTLDSGLLTSTIGLGTKIGILFRASFHSWKTGLAFASTTKARHVESIIFRWQPFWFHQPCIRSGATPWLLVQTPQACKGDGASNQGVGL